MDERESDRRGRDRQHLSAPPSRRQREDEREQRRDDQSPRHCRRQREEVERPRAGPREADQPDLGSRDRDSAAVGAEERGAGGVGEHDGERRQDRGHVQHRGRGVDVREARHERNRRMPGRERIARMQTAVLELVHDAERREVERLELPHAAEMEEPVAVDRVRRPPHRAPEQRRRAGNARDRDALAPLRGDRRSEESRHEADAREPDQQPERRLDRPFDREGQRERARDGGEAPRERGGDRDAEGVRPAECPHEDPAGNEHDTGRRRRKPKDEAQAMRRERPAEEQRRRRREHERQEERGRGDASRSDAVDLHRLAHDSHSRASSASAPARRQAPPRERTPSITRR